MTSPADLPAPVTVQDMWTKAVHDRLAEQNDLLRELLGRIPPTGPVEGPAAGGGAVLVTEPAPARLVPAPAKAAPPPPRKRR